MLIRVRGWARASRSNVIMDRELSRARPQLAEQRPAKGALTQKITSEGIEFRVGPQAINLNGNYEVLVSLTHEDVDTLFKEYIKHVKRTARVVPSRSVKVSASLDIEKLPP